MKKTKVCFKCGKRKRLDKFYRHPQNRDGRSGKCKECTKSDVKQNRDNRIDYYRDYDKKRANLPHRVAAREAYAKSGEGKAAQGKAKKAWIKRNPVKRAAHCILNNAITKGLVQKPDRCEACGQRKSRIEGHHHDYTKPLEVEWLCAKCHAEKHKTQGPF